MRRLLLLALAAMPLPALAQQLGPEQAETVLREGRVLSAATLSGLWQSNMVASPIPQGVRTHELFVLHEGRLFLCYLSGNPAASTAPAATCFGPKLTPPPQAEE